MLEIIRNEDDKPVLQIRMYRSEQEKTDNQILTATDMDRQVLTDSIGIELGSLARLVGRPVTAHVVAKGNENKKYWELEGIAGEAEDGTPIKLMENVKDMDSKKVEINGILDSYSYGKPIKILSDEGIDVTWPHA